MIKNFEFLINDFLTLNSNTLNATNFHKMKILRKNIWSFKKNCREITNYVEKYWKFSKNYCKVTKTKIFSIYEVVRFLPLVIDHNLSYKS